MVIIILISLFVSTMHFSNPVRDTNQIENKKYLALGDSYTIGESVEYQERFPVQLVNKLKFKGINCAQPKIIAKTGWTTDELLEGIEKEDPDKDYDLVTLLIGVNNQYRGKTLDSYQKEFEMLLKKAIEFTGDRKDRVIVISIPDYGVTPFGKKRGRKKIGAEIDEFNQVNLETANSYGISYVDVTEISRTALKKTSLLADDDLHPAGNMYALWVDEIVPVVIANLKGEHAE